MFYVTNTSPFLFDEILLIDLLALVVAIATVSILWYVVIPDEVKDFRFLLTFIFVVVPFVALVCFGLALINYDAIAAWAGWPPVLPLSSSILSPPIIGVVAFYIGQTMWLWWDWRKLQAKIN